jgi:hypothetical protein
MQPMLTEDPLEAVLEPKQFLRECDSGFAAT